MKVEATVTCEVCEQKTTTAFFKPHRLTTTSHFWLCRNCKSYYSVKVQLKKYNGKDLTIHQSMVARGFEYPAKPVDKSEEDGED